MHYTKNTQRDSNSTFNTGVVVSEGISVDENPAAIAPARTRAVP